MTRRQVPMFGAVAAGAAAPDVHGAAAAEASAVAGRARERSFDDGWLFLPGDATDAEAPILAAPMPPTTVGPWPVPAGPSSASAGRAGAARPQHPYGCHLDAPDRRT